MNNDSAPARARRGQDEVPINKTPRGIGTVRITNLNERRATEVLAPLNWQRLARPLDEPRRRRGYPVHWVWLIGIAAFWPGFASAANLLDVYRDALNSDPQYLGSGAANRAAQELRPQARAPLLPNVNLSASTSANDQDIRSISNGQPGTTRFNNRDFTISLTQPVYRKDLQVGLAQADARVQQSNAEHGFALQDLMLRVAERYFGVLAATDDLEFATAERDANEQQLKQSQQRFEVGLIAITDVEEAKAGFDLANAEVIGAENALDNALEALREITGHYLNELAPLGTRLPLIAPEPNDINSWTQTAIEQNLQLTAVRLAADTAHGEIRRQQAFHLPTLDVVAQHNVSKSGGRFGDSDIVNSAIGLELNVPIYQGGLVLSRTREARHLHEQALDNLERQRRITQRQARDAFRGVISGVSRVGALAQAVVSTESALEAIEAGFQVGTRTTVDVLNAQRDLFRAKRDFAQARYVYVLDILRLKQSAGTLSEEDLAEVNRWLD